MTKIGKTILWLIVLVVIVGVILAASKGDKKEVEKEAVKIGVLLPLTGDGAVYGEPARNMLKMAVDEINTSNDENRGKIELIIEDSKCNGKDASSATQKLINVDKVKVIIGGFCSSESISAVPIASENKVALLSPGSSSPDLTGINSIFSRNYPSDASQGSVLAKLAYNDKKFKKVAIIQEQTDYAQGIYKAFSEEFIKLGGTVIKEEFPTSNTDFRSALSKLKDSKSEALLIDSQTPAVAVRILTQLQQLKWKPALMINDAISGDPETLTKNSIILEGAITAQFGIDPTNQKFQNMVNNYKTKYATELPYQSYAQTEYDAVYLIRDAIGAVGNDGLKIAEWLRTVKNWPGASGSITIDPLTGDRVGGHTPLIVKDGKIEAYAVATSTQSQ